MLLKVGNEIIDTNKVPIALVFQDKEEAKVLAGVLENIKNGDTKHPSKGEWWIMHPSSITKDEIDEWAQLTDDEIDLLKSNRISGVNKFEL